MGRVREMRLMSPEPFVVVGIVLALFWNVVSASGEGSAEVHPIELGDSAELDTSIYKAKAKAKELLQVPGIPKWAKVSRSVDDVSGDGCKNACDADKTCAGFQYVAAERRCRIFRAPKKRVKKISLKKAKKLLKKAVKKAVKKEKKKGKKKEKKALKQQKKAMAPKKKKPSAGQKYREVSRKLAIRKSAFKVSKKAAKESAKKSRGSRVAELVTKKNDHTEMMKELKAAKHAQEAGLNFEEQVIMAKTMQDKKVLLAKAHKVGAMAAEETQDKKFEESKVIMKKGLKLKTKMKEKKVKKTTKMVAEKVKMKSTEAKYKIAQKLYKAEERKQKDAQDEKKEKLARKARLYLKKQNKKAERHYKAVQAARAGNKKAKLAKCRRSQVKMRKLKFRLLRRLKKSVYKKERKVANKKVKRMKKGLRKSEKRKVKAVSKKLKKKAHGKVRFMFDLSASELDEIEAMDDLGEDDSKITEKKADKAKAKASKAKVKAKFGKKQEKKAAQQQKKKAATV